jgi:GMP synthase-like glutamine amidotransferase
MRITLLQHVAFEGPGAIRDWAAARGHDLDTLRVDHSDSLGTRAVPQALVVMGGPMGVADENTYPWLTTEKRFVAESARSGAPVLGICLGAQLLADALGAAVRRNAHKEIGWHAIEWQEAARALSAFSHVPQASVVFHWHGDTFDLPNGALPVASSQACRQQGFTSRDGRLIGLQFHLEMRPEDVQTLSRHGTHELLAGGPYVQSEEQMRDDGAQRCATVIPLLFTLLDHWLDTSQTQSQS